MSDERFASIWDALEESPGAAETMKIRSSLMTDLKRHIACAGWTPAQAAERFDVTPGRISDLLCGKIGAFSVESLIGMAARVGMRFELRILQAA